eukprot:1995831-Pleurochrysis_carterae.AAC.1
MYVLKWTCAMLVVRGMCSTRYAKQKKRNTPSAKAKRKGRKRTSENKTEARTKLAEQRRRLIQRRIKKWNKECIRKYDGKDRRKYRHKVRASNRWLKRRGKTEAKEANAREHRRHRRGKGRKDTRRRGGAGHRREARPVHVSKVEEELMKDIGVPQHTWGDGSCWLWAVAGALQQLEGKECPTENDIQLEREWRAAIQDVVKTRGIPITEAELQGLGEGVRYEQGRLMKGGTWGGGTEHQALAILLKVNIVIWDRRYIGRVGAQHRQIYICTPTGQTFLRNAADTLRQANIRTTGRKTQSGCQGNTGIGRHRDDTRARQTTAKGKN